MCSTVAQTCISSVACTPWYCGSLNCSARLVVYFSFNSLVLSTALPDILSLLYLLDTCCVSHTYLANTTWVSIHIPMLFIRCHQLKSVNMIKTHTIVTDPPFVALTAGLGGSAMPMKRLEMYHCTLKGMGYDIVEWLQSHIITTCLHPNEL